MRGKKASPIGFDARSTAPPPELHTLYIHLTSCKRLSHCLGGCDRQAAKSPNHPFFRISEKKEYQGPNGKFGCLTSCHYLPPFKTEWADRELTRGDNPLTTEYIRRLAAKRRFQIQDVFGRLAASERVILIHAKK